MCRFFGPRPVLRLNSGGQLNCPRTGINSVFEGNGDYFVQLNGLLMGRNKTLPGVNFGAVE